MNNEEINLARKNYNELMQQREKEIKEKESKIKILKQEEKIVEYINLSYDVSDEGKQNSKNNILEKSFGEIAKNTEKNDNIYVFVGYYGTDSPNHLAPLSEKNPYARYKYYANLETTDITIIDIKSVSEFGKGNVVLYLDDPKNYHHIGFYREKFNELRNKYFEYLVNNSQEEAVKQIIKKR